MKIGEKGVENLFMHMVLEKKFKDTNMKKNLSMLFI
jgi:hypothetical protein